MLGRRSVTLPRGIGQEGWNARSPPRSTALKAQIPNAKPAASPVAMRSGFILLCIGIIFTEFWALVATGYAFAQVYRMSARR